MMEVITNFSLARDVDFVSLHKAILEAKTPNEKFAAFRDAAAGPQQDIVVANANMIHGYLFEVDTKNLYDFDVDLIYSCLRHDEAMMYTRLHPEFAHIAQDHGVESWDHYDYVRCPKRLPRQLHAMFLRRMMQATQYSRLIDWEFVCPEHLPAVLMAPTPKVIPRDYECKYYHGCFGILSVESPESITAFANRLRFYGSGQFDMPYAFRDLHVSGYLDVLKIIHEDAPDIMDTPLNRRFMREQPDPDVVAFVKSIGW